MAPNMLTRESLQTVQRLLLAGLAVFWLVIGGLRSVGVVPLLPEAPAPDIAAAAVTGLIQLIAWLWARRRVPRRRPVVSVADFWSDPKVTTAVSLVLFLFEGSAMLAAVWTMLTGSVATAVISGLAMIGLATSGPSRYEEPDF